MNLTGKQIATVKKYPRSAPGHPREMFSVYTDRYRWIEVTKILNGNSQTIKQLLLRWFAVFRVSEEISTGGG